jgi:outer membrane protein TolC
MTTANRMQRATHWLAATGLLGLPACASLDTAKPSSGLPLPPTLTARAIPPSRGMSAAVPASAEVEARNDDKDVPPKQPALTLPIVPAAVTQGKPLPINLPTALTLSNANPLDIQIAGERLRAATAQLDRAKVLWLPNIGMGVDYFRQDGQIQDVMGNVFNTSKSSFLVGAGPTAVFSVGDALFAPLAARQVVRARQADVQSARNDTTLQVAEAYFNVQQARGEVAGSIESLRRAEELLKLTGNVAPDIAPTAEINRAKAEVSRRRLAVEAAYERWQVASADLTRILRLEPGTLVEPAEEPSLIVELIDPLVTTEDMIPIALTNRPELAADQAVIQAALAQVRQEKVRPFVPNIELRGTASQVPGLAGGVFGGGINGTMGNFAGRFSFDLQAVWEVQNLGFGNRALVREREAEKRQALLQLLRTQDLVTAEVVQAHAQLRRAANRVKVAADGVADAAETADKNLRGLVPGRKIGDRLTLVFRPQEAVAAVAALDQAYRDYFAAVADHNRAQFRLYRALGHPARCLIAAQINPPLLPATTVPVSAPPPPVESRLMPAIGPAVLPTSHSSSLPQPNEEWRSAGSTAPAPLSVDPTLPVVTVTPPFIKPN